MSWNNPFSSKKEETVSKEVVSDVQYENAKKFFDEEFGQVLTVPSEMKELNKAISLYKKALKNSVKMIKFYANEDQMGKSQEWERKQKEYGETQLEFNIKKIDLNIKKLTDDAIKSADKINGYIATCNKKIDEENKSISEYETTMKSLEVELNREIRFLKLDKAERKGLV
jgi:LPS O-antigen subunit length determinant protein (WzzB/FepE family)